MSIEKTQYFNTQSNIDDKLNALVTHISKKSYLGKLWSSIKFLFKYQEILSDDRIKKFIQNNTQVDVLLNIQTIASTQLSQRKVKNENELHFDRSITYLTKLKKRVDKKITAINPHYKDSSIDQVFAHKNVDLADLEHESKAFKDLQDIANMTMPNDNDVASLFSSMIENGKVDQARLLFKYFIEEAERTIEDTEDFQKCSRALDFKKALIYGVTKALEAEKYLADMHSAKENYILTTYSVDLIISRLKAQKPELNNLPCIICDNLESFQKKLEELYGEASGPDKCFFIIRNMSIETKFSPDRGGHLTPVYIEKNKKDFRSVIMDSTSRAEYNDPLQKILNNALPTKPTIYVNKVLRQRDESSCPIYCIRDFVQFARHGDTMMQKIIESSKSTKSKLREFTTLPAQLMKVMQSLSDIVGYEEIHGSIGLKMKHIKLQFRKKWSVGVKRVLQNTKIDNLSTKYQYMVLDQLMARKS